MSLPVLIGFAGVLVAAVATGVLAGRAVRQPRIGGVLWTAAVLALAAALAAQSAGFASGYQPGTFRAVQLAGLLLAPLWLAWGLAEVTWPAEAARFGARLVCGALTAVGTVILATDPLTAEPFGRSWPTARAHYQPPSLYALNGVQSVAAVLTVVSLGLAVTQSRRRAGAVPGTAAVALAVLAAAALRWPLPERAAYPALSLAAAILAWFGANQLTRRPGRSGAGREPAAGEPESRLTGDRETDHRYDQAAPRLLQPPGSAGPLISSMTAAAGMTVPPGITGSSAVEAASGVRAASGAASAARPAWDAAPAATRADGWPGPPAGPGPSTAPGWPAAPGSPVRTGFPASTGLPASTASPDGARWPGGPPGPVARPHGRIQIFTLLEDRFAEFDRLADQLAEEVRIREPDTLVFVIHLVPDAPMQRIFYEIYRDRTAFDRHESQPYVLRFAADRRSCVLATTVIELRLKYAKVAPLPGPAPRTGIPQALDPLPPRPDRPLPQAARRYGTV